MARKQTATAAVPEGSLLTKDVSHRSQFKCHTDDLKQCIVSRTECQLLNSGLADPDVSDDLVSQPDQLVFNPGPMHA